MIGSLQRVRQVIRKRAWLEQTVLQHGLFCVDLLQILVYLVLASIAWESRLAATVDTLLLAIDTLFLNGKVNIHPPFGRCKALHPCGNTCLDKSLLGDEGRIPRNERQDRVHSAQRGSQLVLVLVALDSNDIDSGVGELGNGLQPC